MTTLLGIIIAIIAVILITMVILIIKKGKTKHLWSVWLEFWHIEIVNGKRRFKFSSKKFHFQIAQFTFYLACYLRMFDSDIAERLDATVLGVIGSHAISTGGWYAWKKNADIKNAEEAE